MQVQDRILKGFPEVKSVSVKLAAPKRRQIRLRYP